MTVRLTMIVKNEAHVIARAIASVRPHIDSWTIVDTGSTDGTQEIVRKELAEVPGELTTLQLSEWSFGAARTHALRAASGHADYALILDADEVVSGKMPKALTAEAYGLWLQFPDQTRTLTHRLFRLDCNWRYEDVIHEYPACDREWDDDITIDTLSLSTPQDGARSRDPLKDRRDIEVLGNAIVNDPTNARYVFHFAQTWRNLGDYERAARHYLQRTEMGPGLNWEEVYVSWLEAGRCLEILGKQSEAIRAYLHAHATWPERGEAPRELARIFSHRATAKPVGSLYVEVT